MTERADKLKIMDRLKAAGLWQQADHYREEARRRLRDEGKTKEEAVAAAWDEMAEKYLPLAEQAMPAAARLAQASIPPPPLAPIDLDETYTEKDFASALVDSIIWVASEYRRVMVPYAFGYTVDYSRARTKPPTALAMGMVEYYVNYPEKLDRLYLRVMKQIGKTNAESTLAEARPKTQDELDAEAYWQEYLRKKEKEEAQSQ